MGEDTGGACVGDGEILSGSDMTGDCFPPPLPTLLPEEDSLSVLPETVLPLADFAMELSNALALLKARSLCGLILL